MGWVSRLRLLRQLQQLVELLILQRQIRPVILPTLAKNPLQGCIHYCSQPSIRVKHFVRKTDH